jgi:hypothetical protein
VLVYDSLHTLTVLLLLMSIIVNQTRTFFLMDTTTLLQSPYPLALVLTLVPANALVFLHCCLSLSAYSPGTRALPVYSYIWFTYSRPVMWNDIQKESAENA